MTIGEVKYIEAIDFLKLCFIIRILLNIKNNNAVEGAIGMNFDEMDVRIISPNIHPRILIPEIKSTRNRSASFLLITSIIAGFFMVLTLYVLKYNHHILLLYICVHHHSEQK